MLRFALLYFNMFQSFPSVYKGVFNILQRKGRFVYSRKSNFDIKINRILIKKINPISWYQIEIDFLYEIISLYMKRSIFLYQYEGHSVFFVPGGFLRIDV